MDVGERGTFGGVAAGTDERYEVSRVTGKEFKVGKYALMIALMSIMWSQRRKLLCLLRDIKR
ncbi:hypothetical protein J6TS7_29230 [Paenibacillus dendritiformis]|nr:hypothetical protein J6TS7_29230 [Paenibacillus dendritiformis]